MASDTPSTPPGRDTESGFGRRDFLRLTTAGAGLLAFGACNSDTEVVPGILPHPKLTLLGGAHQDVVVVGAGLWGSFTAYNLRKRGAKVTLVDQFGAGNSRATSGDETRGVRSTYGDRETGELWMRWARESMVRWAEFDKEWSRYWKTQVFHQTGDICCRQNPEDNIIKRTRLWYDKHKVPYQMMTPAEVKKQWPVVQLAGIPDVADITTVLYEHDAGVVRARRAAQYATVAFEKMGGTVKVGRCLTPKPAGGKLGEIELDTGEKIRADLFVFALGPWHRTFFRDLMGDRMRTPLASVCYFSTPPGDQRFTYPNLPSYNIGGTTGWVAFPIDNRGFRVRGGVRAPAVAGAAGAGGRGGAAGAAGGGRAGRGGARGGAGGGRGGGGRGGRGGAGGAGGATADPATSDPDLSERVTSQDSIDSMRRFLQQRFPILGNRPISETRACHYEGSVNRDFIVDWHPEMSNVLIAGAGNSEGAKFAPVIGDYISQRVVGIVGDPEVAKRFKIPEDTYTTAAAKQAARAQFVADSTAKADSLVHADSVAKARGRGREDDEEEF